jgi:hypothetical protein
MGPAALPPPPSIQYHPDQPIYNRGGDCSWLQCLRDVSHHSLAAPLSPTMGCASSACELARAGLCGKRGWCPGSWHDLTAVYRKRESGPPAPECGRARPAPPPLPSPLPFFFQGGCGVPSRALSLSTSVAVSVSPPPRRPSPHLSLPFDFFFSATCTSSTSRPRSRTCSARASGAAPRCCSRGTRPVGWARSSTWAGSPTRCPGPQSRARWSSTAPKADGLFLPILRMVVLRLERPRAGIPR